jgi:hypothetical protein
MVCLSTKSLTFRKVQLAQSSIVVDAWIEQNVLVLESKLLPLVNGFVMSAKMTAAATTNPVLALIIIVSIFKPEIQISISTSNFKLSGFTYKRTLGRHQLPLKWVKDKPAVSPALPLRKHQASCSKSSQNQPKPSSKSCKGKRTNRTS